MGEQCDIQAGVTATISDDGNELIISDGHDEQFRLQVPEHGIFYTFADHPTHGTCIIVAFDPPAMSTGWSDWYYRVDTAARSIERLGPRR